MIESGWVLNILIAKCWERWDSDAANTSIYRNGFSFYLHSSYLAWLKKRKNQCFVVVLKQGLALCNSNSWVIIFKIWSKMPYNCVKAITKPTKRILKALLKHTRATTSSLTACYRKVSINMPTHACNFVWEINFWLTFFSFQFSRFTSFYLFARFSI